jgi:hypothetical protein
VERRTVILPDGAHSPHAAYRALKQYENEERARIEAAGRSRDNQEQEPFEIPPLSTLRQN